MIQPNHLGSAASLTNARPFPIRKIPAPTSSAKKTSFCKTFSACSAAGLIFAGTSVAANSMPTSVSAPTTKMIMPLYPSVISPSPFERAFRYERSAAAKNIANTIA